MREVGTGERRIAGIVMIYGLVDPRTGEIRYVGQTTSPSRRKWLHCSLSNNKHGGREVCKWIVGLLASGERPRMVEIECVPADEANSAEQKHIAAIPNLLNMNAGGHSMAQCRREKTVRTPLQHVRSELKRASGTSIVAKEALARVDAAIDRLSQRIGRKAAIDHVNRGLLQRKPRWFTESAKDHG